MPKYFIAGESLTDRDAFDGCGVWHYAVVVAESLSDARNNASVHFRADVNIRVAFRVNKHLSGMDSRLLAIYYSRLSSWPYPFPPPHWYRHRYLETKPW